MATFAETMLAKYETLLQTATGLDSISVDGQSVRYSGLEAKYRYWKREVEREQGRPSPRARDKDGGQAPARGSGAIGGPATRKSPTPPSPLTPRRRQVADAP